MLPPLAVSVVLFPLHILVVPLMEGVRLVFTVTVTLAVPVHPSVLVAVTVYDVVDIRVTVIAVVEAPWLHKYVLPPLAVKVVLFPVHIVVVPLIEAVGMVFTVTVKLAVPMHPAAFVAVTM